MTVNRSNSKRPKSLRYKVLHPSGDWESFRLPLCFSPRDVAERLVHSLIFVRVPRGRFIWLCESRCDGPFWALYSARDNGYVLADKRDPERLSDAELAAAC